MYEGRGGVKQEEKMQKWQTVQIKSRSSQAHQPVEAKPLRGRWPTEARNSSLSNGDRTDSRCWRLNWAAIMPFLLRTWHRKTLLNSFSISSCSVSAGPTY